MSHVWPPSTLFTSHSKRRRIRIAARFLAVAVASLLLLSGGRAWAAPGATKKSPGGGEVTALVKSVQRFYEGTSDFVARFEQEYVYKAFGRTQKSSGSMKFKKPGLVRWEYEAPSPKTFLLSDQRVYTYDPAAHLLTKASIDTSQLSASVTFLMGKGNLLQEFDIEKQACGDCAGTLLELKPKKPDARFRKIRLEVDPKSAQVLRSVVFDASGDENTIRFLELKANTGLSKDDFKLTPPEGTQVQDFTKKG